MTADGSVAFFLSLISQTVLVYNTMSVEMKRRSKDWARGLQTVTRRGWLFNECPGGGLVVLSLLVSTVLTACRGAERPPEQPQTRYSPRARIEQVGHSWHETTLSEGFLSDPDVAFARATDTFRINLTAQRSVALVDLDREELFRTRDGRELHCRVRGAVAASVAFAWRLDEATMTIHMPASSLPRRCKESGFNRPTKRFSALDATYALRGDQLVAIQPITLRSSLIPSD